MRAGFRRHMSEWFEPLDVAVVGGGISGLACAFWAKQRGRSVALFEASPDVGGSITTFRSEGYIADGGPQSFLVSDSFAQLISDAKLDAFMVPASPQATTPYIYHRGKLVAVPRSPQTLASSALLSPLAKLRILGEPLVGKSAQEDESVAAFVTRRTGHEVLAALADPFVSGIFAGDARKLSARSAFPLLAEFENEYGSILRGAIARMRTARKNGAPLARRKTVGFRAGNDVLPRALAAYLGNDFTVNAEVKAIWQRGQWMELLITGQPNQHVIAKTIVLATPAHAAADLLEPLEPKAAAALRSIKSPTVVQIAIAYPREAVEVPLNGFGFLASRREELRILGCVWNSAMFPDRCPPDQVLVTAFLGGATDTAVADQSDEELARAAHADLARTLRIRNAAPHIVTGFRWQDAIPQYNVGHGGRLRAINESLARLPNVRLCGNYLRGPSVPDCIKLAQEVAASLEQSTQQPIEKPSAARE